MRPGESADRDRQCARRPAFLLRPARGAFPLVALALGAARRRRVWRRCRPHRRAGVRAGALQRLRERRSRVTTRSARGTPVGSTDPPRRRRRPLRPRDRGRQRRQRVRQRRLARRPTTCFTDGDLGVRRDGARRSARAACAVGCNGSTVVDRTLPARRPPAAAAASTAFTVGQQPAAPVADLPAASRRCSSST